MAIAGEEVMMLPDKVAQAVEQCQIKLPHSALDDEASAHLLYMCNQINEFIAEDRREKAMRWLGFVQGALWQAGVFTIDELKNHNRPDGDP